MKHISGLLHFNQTPSQRRFDPVPPKRAAAIKPIDDGTFILPLQQSFIKNNRIMSSTCRLIALLSGWAGQGAPIETTQGILAKHIGRSVRQVQRMLNDACREGYLSYSYTKSRIGMITGIKIFLRLGFIRKSKPSKQVERPINQGTTQRSDTNGNPLYYTKDTDLESRLRSLSRAMGMGTCLE